MTARGSGMGSPASPLPATVVKLPWPSTRRWMKNTASANAVSISDKRRSHVPGPADAPTMAKKISVDSTANCPPTTIGVAEVGHALDEAHQKGVGQARLEQGQRDGRRRSAVRLARSVCAASSMDGLTPCTTPRMIMKAIGVKANSCASQTPKKPVEPARGLNAKGPLQILVEEPGAPEQQDQARARRRTAA